MQPTAHRQKMTHQPFQVLRAALGAGSLLMLLAGLRLAVQPQTVAVADVKSGINQLIEDGTFDMQTVTKPVVPALLLLWGGLGGLSVSLLVPTPDSIQTQQDDQQEDRYSGDTSTLAKAITPPATGQRVQGTSLQDFWLQGVGMAKLARTLGLRARLQLLDRAIGAHEHGWIDRLLCCPCLLVIARPASGKSSFAAALAICRELLLNDLKLTIVADPNANLKTDKGIWQSHWRLAGAGDDWQAIGGEITAMYRRFADSQGQNFVSSIYDELTAYDGNVDPHQLGGLLPQITSKARDSEEYIILVSHNDTLKCLGGQPGEAKLKNDMVQLNLGSRSAARGKLVPTGTGTIEGLDFDEQNKPVTQPITLPRWFDPVYLAQLFPEVYQGGTQPGADCKLPANESPFTVVSEPFETVTAPATERLQNHGSTVGSNDETAAAARLAAARTIQQRCISDLQVEPQEADILAAMNAITAGLAPSRIIKEVLRLTGSNYQSGKQVIALIQQTISNPNE